MKWSYTNGKLNISSDESDQQFLLKELIEEVLPVYARLVRQLRTRFDAVCLARQRRGEKHSGTAPARYDGTLRSITLRADAEKSISSLNGTQIHGILFLTVLERSGASCSRS